MNTKTVLLLGVIGAACAIVYKRMAIKAATGSIAPMQTTRPGFFGGLSAVSWKALGLAPLGSPAHWRLGYEFQAGPDGLLPLIPRSVGSGLYEGTYSPGYLSSHNLGG